MSIKRLTNQRGETVKYIEYGEFTKLRDALKTIRTIAANEEDEQFALNSIIDIANREIKESRK